MYDPACNGAGEDELTSVGWMGARREMCGNFEILLLLRSGM